MARKIRIPLPKRGSKTRKKTAASQEPPAPAAKPKRTRTRKPKSSAKSGRRKTQQPSGLTFDQKLDIGGVLLFLAGVLLLLALFSPNNGDASAALLNILAQAFGIGRYGVPIVMIAVGVWIWLRHFGDQLPHIEPVRTVGAVALYVALLVFFHLAQTPATPEQSLALGRAGLGGGMLGANVLEALISWFGWFGMWITMLAWVLIALIITLGLSTQDMYHIILGLVARLRGQSPERTDPFMPYQQPLPEPRATARIPEDDGEADKPAGPVHPPRVTDTKPGKKPKSRSKKPAKEPAPAGEPMIPTPLSPYQQPIVIGGEQPWVLPKIADILDEGDDTRADDDFDRRRTKIIEETLAAFGAPGKVVEINRGPVITQFGVEPEYITQRSGKRTKVKVSKIAGLSDDLALALSAASIRIEAPVSGKGYVGIEVPNSESVVVALRDVMESAAFDRIESPLTLALGQDVSGQAVCADLTKMPHLLIAGTTGSGKSVCVNAVISALLLTNTPDDLKFLMVDPKRVELTNYRGLPHMLVDVVVDLERVVTSLQWVAREMDSRYTRFSKYNVRNIAEFNQHAKANKVKKMPYLVVIIDELADLMMLAPEETEKIITRLAQLARATGIHLIIATQRPSVDVVTGLIKANFPARISFAVASSVDSRVILDQPGAEKLLGRGDMLFISPDAAQPIRMQGTYVDDNELYKLVHYWKGAYIDGALEEAGRPQPQAAKSKMAAAQPAGQTPAEALPKQTPLWKEMQAVSKKSKGEDDLLEDAIRVVREMRKASISLLQRRLRIGYTRSARLIDILEERGIVGPPKTGAQQREVLDYGELEETTTYDQKDAPL